MRYLLCAMLLTVLVSCDDSTDSIESNVRAATADASQHEGEHDQGRLDHFEGHASEDWAAAIANLQAYNQKLEAVLQQDEISRDELVDIHEWSYTLENALARLQAELTTTAEHLEEVHLASEHGDVERVREHAQEYLKGLDPLLAE